MRLYAIALFFSLISVTSFGQDPVFSQYYINSMHLNPAIAGSANEPRVFLHYRNQWPGINNSFVTYQASYDQFVKPLNGGIGINVLRDNIAGGIITSTNLDLIYSYRFKASHKLTFQAGLQASFNFFSTNVPVDNESGLTSQSTTQPDFGIGILGITKNSQIGLSVNHLNANYLRFNSYFVEAPMKISFFYARKFKIYDKDDVKERGFFITPAVMVQMQSASLMIN